MKVVILVSAMITFVVSVLGTHFVSKKVGRKEAVNILKKEQLLQTAGDYLDKINSCSEDRNIPAINKWYEDEKEAIEVMYDEILETM